MAAAVAGALWVGVACASADPWGGDDIGPVQSAQVGAICKSVLGLEPGEEHYVNCAASLSHSLHKLGRSLGLQAARDSCLAKGLKPGDPALSECELASMRAGSAAAGQTSVGSAMPHAKSFFYASTGEVRGREQQACAMIGYDPIYGGFSDCVAGLQAALFAADHPMN